MKSYLVETKATPHFFLLGDDLLELCLSRFTGEPDGGLR